MKLRPNQTALLTGASGGLGTYIARALAAYGINQALVAFPGKDLPPLKEELEKNGIYASRKSGSVSWMKLAKHSAR